MKREDCKHDYYFGVCVNGCGWGESILSPTRPDHVHLITNEICVMCKLTQEQLKGQRMILWENILDEEEQTTNTPVIRDAEIEEELNLTPIITQKLGWFLRHVSSLGIPYHMITDVPIKIEKKCNCSMQTLMRNGCECEGK